MQKNVDKNIKTFKNRKTWKN